MYSIGNYWSHPLVTHNISTNDGEKASAPNANGTHIMGQEPQPCSPHSVSERTQYPGPLDASTKCPKYNTLTWW